MSTNVSRLAATVIAAATVTALTTAAAVAEPPAPPRLVDAQVNLAASTGLYPIGPIPQAFRSLGMGTAQDFMNGLAGLAQLIPGDAGQGLKRTVEDVAALLVALQTGINLPILGNIAIPEIAVPPLGPAGTIDQINTSFQINCMPVVSSNYWPKVHGRSVEDVRQDAEGLLVGARWYF